MPRSDYPIEFAPPFDEKVIGFFYGVGLSSRDNEHVRLRGELFRNGSLFALIRPNFGSVPPWPHTTYVQALRGAPVIGNYAAGQDWLKDITRHLDLFSSKPKARSIISKGIATFFNKLTDNACCPEGATEAMIPYTSRNAVGERPLDFTGTNFVQVAIKADERFGEEGKRQFLPLSLIAAKIGWIIPGIDAPETQAAILDAFNRTKNSERPADPRALFMASQIIMDQTKVQAGTVFTS